MYIYIYMYIYIMCILYMYMLICIKYVLMCACVCARVPVCVLFAWKNMYISTRIYSLMLTYSCTYFLPHLVSISHKRMGWLRLVGSLKLHVSFAKETYKRDYILQKRPIILRSLQVVATP